MMGYAFRVKSASFLRTTLNIYYLNSMRVTRFLKPFSVLMMVTLVTGCSTITQDQQFGDFEGQLQRGDIYQASSYAVEHTTPDPDTGNATDLLWSLQAGAVLRTQGSYQLSSQYFDDAEALIKAEHIKNSAKKVAGETASFLVKWL